MCASTLITEVNNPDIPSVNVAAGVVSNARGQILLSQRAANKHEGGTWEFPGGKVEAEETDLQALARELREELGICITEASFLMTVPFDYPKLRVNLSIWKIGKYNGEPAGCEGQALQWLEPRQLRSLALPLANQGVVTALQLPNVVLVTPEPAAMAEDLFLNRLQQLLDGGVSMIQFRSQHLSTAQRLRLAEKSRRLCADHDALYLHNGTDAEAIQLGADGVHLNSVRLHQDRQRVKYSELMYSSVCHHEHELMLARQQQMDFIFISPVAQTNSHPHQSSLGWRAAQTLLDQAQMPAYFLGGMTELEFERAFKMGAQGLAMSSTLWQAPESVALLLGRGQRRPVRI